MFEENWSEKKTMLRNGAEALMISSLFEKTAAWDYSAKLIQLKQEKLEEAAEAAAAAVLDGPCTRAAAERTPTPKKKDFSRGRVPPMGSLRPPPRKSPGVPTDERARQVFEGRGISTPVGY